MDSLPLFLYLIQVHHKFLIHCHHHDSPSPCLLPLSPTFFINTMYLTLCHSHCFPCKISFVSMLVQICLFIQVHHKIIINHHHHFSPAPCSFSPSPSCFIDTMHLTLCHSHYLTCIFFYAGQIFIFINYLIN